MSSIFKQIYRYTHSRPYRHNETLWPYMKIGRASTGEINQLSYRGRSVPIASLSALKGTCQGKILLTATGPSVKDIKFIHPAPLPAMGVNGAWSLHQHMDFQFYVVVDMGFFDKKAALIAEVVATPDLILFTTAHGIARILDRYPAQDIRCSLALIEDAAFKIYQPKITLLATHYKDAKQTHFAAEGTDIGFTTDIRQGIFDAGTVIYWALQILAYLGFDQVFIIGLDMNNFTQPRFYETVENKLSTHLQENIESLIMPAFAHASNVLKKENIKIINLSPKSAIPDYIFEKASYNETIF